MGFTAAARGCIVILSILGGRFITASQVYRPIGLRVKVESSSECSVYSCTWAELKCVSDQYLPPSMSFVWYKNEEIVPGETASSYSDYFYDEDNCACAIMGHEHHPSPIVCVYLDTCNRVTYSYRSTCAPRGSTVNIYCLYNAYEKDFESRFWFGHRWSYSSHREDIRKDSQYAGRVQVFDEKRSNGIRSNLRISNLRESDADQYDFKFKTGSFKWKNVLPGTYLTVTDLELTVATITTETSYVLAEVTCHSRCSEASYVFFKNGNKITSGSSRHRGYFYPGDTISCALERYEDYRSPSLYTPRDPSVWASPSGEIMEGSSVTLTCNSDANPAAEYSWYKYANSYQTFLGNGAQLVLRYIQPSGSAEYRCTAQNKLGRSHNSISINVKYAPKTSSVSMSPSGEIVEGSSVTLTCSSDANPAATHTWYKENQQLLQGPGNYHFTSISSEDRGTYYCKSENQYGRVMSSSLSIDVKYVPRLPSVSVSPSAEIVEGSSVTLTCSSDANPAANYTWYKENQTLIQGPEGIYNFSSISSEDRGNYSCKSENKYREINSSFLFLDVQYGPRLPSVSVSPSAEIVEGSSVTLTCSSDANPAANYTWYKENQMLFQGQDGIYHFSSISSEDRGNYYCKSDNLHGEINSSFLFIDVQYGPRLPSVSVSPSAEIVEGSSVTLTCSSDANPAANYTWYKENGDPDLQPLSKDPQLVFRSFRFSDSGEYYCTAENQLGRRTSEYICIDMTYGPRLPSVSVSPSAEIVEGSSVTLTCSSDANPAANYTWYKENQTLIQGPEGFYHFSSISSEDRGNYYCKSENQYGEINSSSLFIDVLYAPKFPRVTHSAEIVEGNSVTLTCSSDANPAANYTWYKENQTLIQGPGGTYVFYSLSSKDNGIYHCKSENIYGWLNSTPVNMNVQYGPRLPSLSVSPSAEMMEGASVNLTCSSDANPAANYTWYKENEDSPKASGQIFTITDIRAEHSGNYYCEAQNRRGRHNSTLQLIVVSRSMKSVAAGSMTAILLVIICLFAFFLIRQKRSMKQKAEGPDNNAQPNVGPVYDNCSATAQRNPSEEQDDLNYATVSFSKNQEDPLYSNVGLANPKRQQHEEEEEEEDEDGVEYTFVNFKSSSSSPELRCQEVSVEDSSALYSTVTKTPRV
ncbi:B-cell receptor CD22-like isoform X1 [Acanthopagrus latus]|uniref:B-cell receptor CD22-like isoform X1 n=1 Tax=Acanthopagrus latus TaxID=8177 RepID=UPI00187C703A|nr:B-cell receptor CD22-like isoform X1 [Acanthopagrus latus]